MIKAALKSLLGRKVRLLLSTFAIVLGVAFVAGSLIFSDTLSRSFTALFASTVGDVVVRPEGGTTADGAPSTVTLPGSLVEQLRDVPGAARVDGNVNAFGVFVVSKTGKVVSGFGPPAIGGNWSDAPAGHGLEGLGSSRVTSRTAPTRWCSTSARPSAPGTSSATGSTSSRRPRRRRRPTGAPAAPTRIQPELVGIAGFPSGGSLNGATYAAFDTPTAQDLFLGGEDAYTDIWVTAADGVSQERAARRRRAGAARRRRGGHRRRRGRRVGVRPARGDLVPHDLPADLRRHLAGRRRLPDRQHLLDPGRPAQPRARAAARPRRLQAPGDVVGAARGVRARRPRRDHRPRPRRPAGDGHPRALRELRARPLRPAADLRAAHLHRVVRRRHPGHDGRRVAAGPADRTDRAGPGDARRHRAARVVAAPPARGGDSRSPSSVSSCSRSGSSPTCRTVAGRSAAACSRSCSASRR